MFRLGGHALSADQLGLSRAVQNMAAEAGGLVLVAGPRSSGKRTLVAALVDVINRTRRAHVITIEREINLVHERVNALVSQREVRSDDDAVGEARAALREDPDVLVIEQIRTRPLMDVALEAAAAGHLVIGGVVAHSATEAVTRTFDLYAPDAVAGARRALAVHLRGVVAQVLLSRIGGGRVAAREVLLNTPGGKRPAGGREDLAAPDGDRRGTARGHGAARRGSGRPRAERHRRRARGLSPRCRPSRSSGRCSNATASTRRCSSAWREVRRPGRRLTVERAGRWSAG